MPIEVRLKPVETLLFRGEIAAAGKFRCRPGHPLFEDSGPCSHHTFVFPRAATAIRHDGREEFIAAPGDVVFYNEGQKYRRRDLSGIDASDWFTVAADVLIDLVSDGGTTRTNDRRPFTTVQRRAHPDLFLRQRALFDQLDAGMAIDAMEVEEEVLAILRESMPASPRRALPRRDVEAVEETRERIVRHLASSFSLRRLASEVSVSPFRLCRAFRRHTGMTLTTFIHSVRLSVAVSRLRDPSIDLTALALDLGYSSHSHFSARFRRHFGRTPSAVRSNGVIPRSLRS